MVVCYFHAPIDGGLTTPNGVSDYVQQTGTGLSARRRKGGELASFLVGNDFRALAEIEVVAHGDRDSVRFRNIFRTDRTPLSPK